MSRRAGSYNKLINFKFFFNVHKYYKLSIYQSILSAYIFLTQKLMVQCQLS